MKVVSFQCYLIFHTSRTIFWLEYLWYSRARIYFPATYFLYFVAQIARIPSLFFCEYHERQTFLTQKTFSFAYLWVKEIAEKLEKFECWMVKWSSRNESFEDLETKGKTKSGMNKAVKIVLKG